MPTFLAMTVSYWLLQDEETMVGLHFLQTSRENRDTRQRVQRP